MTGIERLRELGREQEERSWSKVGKVHGQLMLDIADQIDREQDEHARCQLADYLRVRAVERDMERHVLGHEGMEDSPVARWARELREALGGDKHDPANDVSMSAYDLLPADEREAIAWVREHGGIDYVMHEWQSRVPRDRYERRRQRLLDHIAECETALGRRRRRIKELGRTVEFFQLNNSNFRHLLADVAERLGFTRYGDDYEPEDLLDALDRRLMPEGMEWLLEVWPKWSNGEYCKFGDWWTADKYGDYEPRQLRRLAFYTPEQLREWGQDEGDNFGYEWDFMRPSDTTYRPDKAEPPAPKVLDADGAEIREGDTVWTLRDARELEVTGLYPEQDSCPVKVKEHKNGAYIFSGVEPSDLTHQRPVLDADGVPIRVGDTVYFTDGRRQECNTVVHAKYDYKDEPYVQLGRLNEVGYPTYTNCSCIDPSQLTHAKPEPPDSWERLEEDAGKNPFDYCKDVGNTCENSEAYKAHDLVRRARALAGGA